MQPVDFPLGILLNRRCALATAATGLAWTAAASAAAARTPAVPDAPGRVAGTLNMVIPANEGGGWDQTGRTLGAALVASGAVGRVQYENIGGKGGITGLERYTASYASDPDALLIGGFVMVGAVALQHPAVRLADVRPLARLTSDYPVVVVAQDSPLRTAADLVAAIRADASAVPVAGGSAGGIDHLFAALLLRAAKASPSQLVYQPFASGREVVDAVTAGKARVGISGYSEFAQAIGAGRMRAIGIGARRPVRGIPSLREQGVDADLANWRGVFTGLPVPDARALQWVAAIERATQSEVWQHAVGSNRWEPAFSTGKDLADFIQLDDYTTRALIYMLKLKA
ncbi:MAG: tripartite tricarboxylate transporter substrate-binding protein [Pseudomonadota bacterium]